MKSPETGKEMSLQRERREITFRKEDFSVIYRYYLCEDTGEQFTTTELEEINLLQVYNKYREKHRLPFPGEIKAIRERYGLSASKMSEILGFGTNMYRNYENGEVPNESNSRLIQMARHPEKFKYLVTLSSVYEPVEEAKVIRNIDQLIEKEKQAWFSFEAEDFLLGRERNIGIATGYTLPNLKKLRQMIIYFTEATNPFKTKLNKLLFYADFVNFRETCYSISGAQYRAIDMGPVPNNYGSIFEYAAQEGDIDIQIKTYSTGAIGEHFLPNPNSKFDESLFDQHELASLEKVVKEFKKTTVSDIIDISHKEKAWYENFQQGKKVISYEYGFELETI